MNAAPLGSPRSAVPSACWRWPAPASSRREGRANWDLDAALGAICANAFPFPVLQLQADRDPAQPPALFAGAAARCPNVRIEWITGASHFDNFDQPAQVAAAINRFVRAAERQRREQEGQTR